MTRIVCQNTCCVNWNGSECDRAKVFLCCMEENGCLCFEDYTDSEGYQSEFFKTYSDEEGTVNGGRPYRILHKGKRLEANGYTLYTQDDDRWGDDIEVTEATTGLRGPLSFFRDAEKAESVRQKVREKAALARDYPVISKYEAWKRDARMFFE